MHLLSGVKRFWAEVEQGHASAPYVSCHPFAKVPVMGLDQVGASGRFPPCFQRLRIGGRDNFAEHLGMDARIECQRNVADRAKLDILGILQFRGSLRKNDVVVVRID